MRKENNETKIQTRIETEREKIQHIKIEKDRQQEKSETKMVRQREKREIRETEKREKRNTDCRQ